MKIGIDARFLTHPQAGGFKTYSQNLVGALAQLDTENEYIIYVDRPALDGTLVTQDNITYRVVRGIVPGLETAVREQIQLRRAIRRDRPDVIHFLCNTAPVNFDMPYILTLHDTIQVTVTNRVGLTLDPRRYKHIAIAAYSKWTIIQTAHKAERIITVSEYEKRQIAHQLHVARELINVTHLAPSPVYRAVDAATRTAWRQDLRRKIGLPVRFLLGVGYEPRKNIAFLIDVFARLAPEYPDLGLVVVVAQDAARQAFQRLVAQLGLVDRVLILDSQAPATLARLYNLAEVFVYPSERESFGLPPLEALACGTPTVAMNVSSLPEILQGGALLVDGKDVQHWVDVVAGVLSDAALRSELAQRGVARAAGFDWAGCAQKTLEAYSTVAAHSRQQRKYFAMSVGVTGVRE